MGGGLVWLGFEVIGWVGEGCRLLFSVCELLVLCGHCTLCRLRWWWPACIVNAYGGGGGGASGLVGSICGREGRCVRVSYMCE